MKQISSWLTPIVALASGIVVSATLLHYAEAHRSGTPGGYFTLCLGALSVGVLAGAGSYFSIPAAQRAISTAIAVAVLVSLATAGVLVVTLVWAYGS
jgi:hypothetical protein